MLLNPYRFVTGSGDPYWANVVLLLHMDGTDASTTFTDHSSSAKTVTANGNAQIDTAQSKFGGASGLFDGSGDYLSLTSHADFNFGTADFTIEGWVRFNSLTGAQSLISNYQNTSNGFSLEMSASKLQFNATGDGVDSQGVTTLSTGQLYHWAVAREGTNLRLFLDGQVEDTDTNSANITSTAILALGRLGSINADYLNGWLDDVRITKGVARYTANFTVPSAAFPNS